MTVRTSGPYAAGALLLGAIGLATRDFALQWQPVAAGLPVRPLLALASAAILLAGGALALWPRRTSIGAGVLAACYGLWVLLLHLPRVVVAPGDLAVWLGVSEILALASGGAILALLARGPTDNAQGMRLARLAFGVCPLVFGASHLVYAQFTASMVPAWIPGGQLFWAYATGIAHIAAGLAVLSGVLARLAAVLLAAMCGGFVVLLHAPRVAAAPTSQIEWTMLGIALSLTGAAWIVAQSYGEELAASTDTPVTSALATPADA